MVAVAEVAIIIAVVGWFLAPTIKDLMDSARSYAKNEYKWYKGLKGNLQKLAEALEQINGVVGDDCRPRFVNNGSAVIYHLWDLKDAIHDAEELLDTFQYEIHEANLNMKKRNSVTRTINSTVDFGKQVIGSKSSSKELKKLIKRLDELYKSSQDLIRASQLGAPPHPRPITAPMPIKEKIFGYEEEYPYLYRLIAGDAEVVGIIGHAGTGKTELARQAFSYFENGKPMRFDFRIWVGVYGKFSDIDLLREIWKSAFGLEVVGEMNVASLQRELTERFRDRPYLLVLDDVCNDESEESECSRRATWDTVLSPFKQHRNKGSRILMTTRAEICLKTLGASARVQLKGIGTDAATKLLKNTALGNEHADVPRNLERLFQDHVRKLHGSPLAAEEVGVKLKDDLHPAKWKQNLIGDHPDRLLKSYLSSYQDLSSQLQRCFAFCSIFPADWRFDPDNLARMWVALGFVGVSSLVHGGQTTEDVARGYFDALLQRSFFKEGATVKGKSGSGYYVIHQHIHSMLRRVSPKYYLSIDGSRSSSTPIPLTVRHLSVTTSCLDQLKGYPDGLKKVRTLLVFNDATPSSSTVTTIDSEVLEKFKGVRVLDFSDTHMAELPKSISKLRSLRYLGLPNSMEKLGSDVTKLYLLQTLGVIDKNGRFQGFQDGLPDEMSNLTNLRHLVLYMRYIANIHGIGSLGQLQGSVEFHASKSKEGHGMEELGKLNSLRKMLSIKGLETVTSTQESKTALLDKKEHLKDLWLEWKLIRSAQEDETSDSAVLEGLQPHPNLEKLHITRYLGTTSPQWLANPEVLWNLRSLYLRNCRKLQGLPLVGRLPHLELLHAKELWSVERIDRFFCRSGDFSSLKKMVLDDMPELVAWDADDIAVPCGGGGINNAPILFPRLEEVKILDCPNLSVLSGLLCCRLSLTDLEVEKCPAIIETFSWSSFPSLTRQKLHIFGCHGLEFVESPSAEEVAPPCPTHHGHYPVSAWPLLFVFLCLCILYQTMATLFAPATF